MGLGALRTDSGWGWDRWPERHTQAATTWLMAGQVDTAVVIIVNFTSKLMQLTINLMVFIAKVKLFIINLNILDSLPIY